MHDRIGASAVEAAAKVVAADTDNGNLEIADLALIQNNAPPVTLP
jgi:hypothetical protein